VYGGVTRIPAYTGTNAGLKAARARGRMGGRPPMLDSRQINRMIEMYDEQKNTVAEICKIYDISRPLFYNYLNKIRRKNDSLLCFP
jgi:DNA invertase Pin-like site-specific DNA recombinase